VHEYIARSLNLRARDGTFLHVPLGGVRKRAFDITLTSIALIALAPILLATAGLVRCLIRRSVLVTDEWIGFGGKAFTCYRFCSVATGGDTSSALLRINDPSWVGNLESALCTSGLDWLPLLFNVLRGDMSLVGPRPITANELSGYDRLMPEYFSARPGITGLRRHMRKMGSRRAAEMALDRYYIRYWSVWLDLRLLIRILSAVA
jgi:exopolysaccharide production protein ExoY